MGSARLRSLAVSVAIFAGLALPASAERGVPRNIAILGDAAGTVARELWHLGHALALDVAPHRHPG